MSARSSSSMNSRGDAKRKWEISFLLLLFVSACFSVKSKWDKMRMEKKQKWKMKTIFKCNIKKWRKTNVPNGTSIYSLFLSFFLFWSFVCWFGFCCYTALPFGTLFATQLKTHFQRNSTKISLLFWRFLTHKNGIFALRCVQMYNETLSKCVLAARTSFFQPCYSIIAAIVHLLLCCANPRDLSSVLPLVPRDFLRRDVLFIQRIMSEIEIIEFNLKG